MCLVFVVFDGNKSFLAKKFVAKNFSEKIFQIIVCAGLLEKEQCAHDYRHTLHMYMYLVLQIKLMFATVMPLSFTVLFFISLATCDDLDCSSGSVCALNPATNVPYCQPSCDDANGGCPDDQICSLVKQLCATSSCLPQVVCSGPGIENC